MSGSELSALTSAIDDLAGLQFRELDASSLRETVLGLQVACERLTAVSATAVQAFDAAAYWADEGASNMANWLTAKTGTPRPRTGSQVWLARNLAQMPVAAEAMTAGELTESHVRVLARGLNPRTLVLFTEHEAALVASAKTLSAEDFAIVMDEWLNMADPDGAEPRPERPDELHISQTLDGRIEGRFSLTRELGLAILEAIRAKTDELFRRDKQLRDIDPTDPLLDDAPATRRARALSELVEAGSAAKGSQRRKPAFTLIVRERVDAAGNPVVETFDGWRVAWRVAETWMCDSWLLRAVLNADGVPLDLGRMVRSASEDQRRALAARDRGCVVWGCDRPVSWCDAHHLDFWSKGGGTDIGNLVLLCRHHHRRVHKKELVVRMISGRPHVYTAAGLQIGGPDRPEHPRSRLAA